MDGCHWFNCDVGVYGTKYGKAVVENYTKIFEELESKNLLVEKAHLSDIVYNKIYRKQKVDYNEIENRLSELNFKIVLVVFPEDKELIKGRIKDRLSLYPHYGRILKTVDGYIEQQRLYLAEIKKSKLPHLVVETNTLPDSVPIDEILEWIGEK